MGASLLSAERGKGSSLWGGGGVASHVDSNSTGILFHWVVLVYGLT